MAMTITSPVFRHEGAIPARYTCEGDDVSPPLMLGGVPPAAKSLALIVDDPDAPDPAAPKRVWVHWVIYNVPPTTKELPEGVRADALPTGARVGKNDWGNAGYGGPCPPIGYRAGGSQSTEQSSGRESNAGPYHRRGDVDGHVSKGERRLTLHNAGVVRVRTHFSGRHRPPGAPRPSSLRRAGSRCTRPSMQLRRASQSASATTWVVRR